MIDSIRVMTSPKRLWIGTEADPAPGAVGDHLSSCFQLALAEHKMSDDEQTAQFAFDRDAPMHCGFVAGREGADGDYAIGERVDPAAVAQAHLEQRRNG